MPILAMSSGTVTAVWGHAFLRQPDGQLRPVQVGDKVAAGAQIVTADDGLVQIAPELRPEAVAARPAQATDAVANLDNLDELEAPAAGLLGGLGGALSPGLRVDRVAESVTPQAFAFGTERVLPPSLQPVTALQPGTVAQAATPTPTPTPPLPEDPPTLSVAAGPTVVEGSPAVFTLTLSHASATPVSVALKLLSGLTDPVTGRSEHITPGVDSTPLEVLDPLTGQWVPLNGSLVFAPGTTSLQVRVPTVNDRLVEGDETVALQAQVDGGTVAGSNGPFSAEVLVRDNDAESTFFEFALAGRGTPMPMPAAVTGSLGFTDAEGQPLAAQLTAPTDALTTASGQPVVWSSDGQGGLVGRAGSAPDAVVVASVRLLPDGGHSFALGEALRHADGSQAGAPVLDVQFGVQARDASLGVPPGTLTVHVVDDQPHLPALADIHVTTLNTNLLLVLDTSNSMNAASGLPGLTRLQAAVQALQQLIDRHDQAGAVAVRLVTFSDVGQAHGDHWMSASEAKALLGTLSASGSGYTNYDDALSVARAAFGTEVGRLDGAQNVSCFLSDGNPTLSSDFPTPGLVSFTDASGQTVQAIQNGTTQTLLGDGLSASETASWTAFLAAHQIQSHAIGMGSEVSATHLDPIAYDGLTLSDTAGRVVSSLDDLPGALLASAASDVVSGRLLTTLASAGGQVGADGLGQVTRITIDGVTHDHFDTSAPLQTFTTAAGGVFSIDVLTSAYSYRAPSGHVGLLQDEIGFTLVDRDGDPASAVLRFSLAPIQLQFGTAGNDVLHGGAGVDVFAWHFSDASVAGLSGAPAVDHISGFGAAAPSLGGDSLDLRDLLQGEHGSVGAFNLNHFLHIGSEAGSTVIRVSTAGDFSASDASAGTETQRIVLDGVDLLASVGAGLSEQQFIARLVEQGKLLVDA